MLNHYTLWTIQPESVMNILEKKGYYCSNSNLSNWYSEIDFKRSYDWMSKEMIKKGILNNGYGDIPIFLWYQYSNSKKRKPDLRNSGLLDKGCVGYRIELKKDISKSIVIRF